MMVKLLTDHQARPSLHLSKCHNVGNLMPRLKCILKLITHGAIQVVHVVGHKWAQEWD